MNSESEMDSDLLRFASIDPFFNKKHKVVLGLLYQSGKTAFYEPCVTAAGPASDAAARVAAGLPTQDPPSWKPTAKMNTLPYGFAEESSYAKDPPPYHLTIHVHIPCPRTMSRRGVRGIRGLQPLRPIHPIQLCHTPSTGHAKDERD